jgi:hypothetical protein
MTAVEWLTEKLRTEFGFAFSNNILEQAKEMEKQQRGYSEKEVIELLNRREEYTSQAPKTDWFSINKWFNQFKNK